VVSGVLRAEEQHAAAPTCSASAPSSPATLPEAVITPHTTVDQHLGSDEEIILNTDIMVAGEDELEDLAVMARWDTSETTQF